MREWHINPEMRMPSYIAPYYKLTRAYNRGTGIYCFEGDKMWQNPVMAIGLWNGKQRRVKLLQSADTVFSHSGNMTVYENGKTKNKKVFVTIEENVVMIHERKN